jgi:hypothetical protein
MSASETLRMLAAGERPGAGLLHIVRLEAFGVESYGEEAVVEVFSRHPLKFSDELVIAEAPGHIAAFDGANALIGDLYGNNISRLWRLGGGQPFEAEAGISVVFDPDLAQARGDVFFTASDHPALATDAADRAIDAGRAITRDSDKRYRSRAFTVRAFGTATEGIALFAVYRLSGAPVRTSGFAMAAAHWTPDGLHIFRDFAGEQGVAERAWTPRIGD